MELLIEIGCEELPAGSLKPALAFLAAQLGKELDEARLNGAGEGQQARIETHATPRRLALIASGLPARAADVQKIVQGPPARAAFGPDGKPTKAAEGFAKKLGVPVSALRVEGDRVLVTQELKGQTAQEALPGIVERLVRGIPFKKAMRWGDQTEAFARPIHWIGAALDGARIPLRFADVESGLTTRGHRFHAPAEIPLPPATKYLESLRGAHVLADWTERRGRVWEEVQRAAAEAATGSEPLPDEDLLETVTGLVEEPTAVLGRFEAHFLELPPEVLISEMRDHQKYFAVRDAASGKLLPSFVAVSNTKVIDPAVSRRGYERVLRARLSDGRFFFDEDRKAPLASRLERLSRITFFQGLGSQADRVQRLEQLSLWLSRATGRGDEGHLARAAQLCKADLTTGMVGEFPDLQGAMGRVYALASGEPAPVAEAILEHYLPKGQGERMPGSDEGALLGMADRLDQLTGFFGLGKEPSGTADPYALRRAAIGIARLVLARGFRIDLRAAFAEAQRLHGAQKAAGAKNGVSQQPQLIEKLWTFFSGRLEVLWKEAAATDAVQFVLHSGDRDLVRLQKNLAALGELRGKNQEQFEAVASAFKRIANILGQAREKKLAAMAFAPSAIPQDSAAERELAQAFQQAREQVASALSEREDFPAAYAALASLRPSVDRFFDQVMVMAPDEKLRDNRLALLRSLHELFSPLGDFSRLQAEA